MKFVIQFLIVIGFSFLGEFLHYLIPLPIPASIYGIALLFAALECKLLKVNDIREVSSFLIAVMPMMFIPAAVGLITSWDIISTPKNTDSVNNSFIWFFLYELRSG